MGMTLKLKRVCVCERERERETVERCPKIFSQGFKFDDGFMRHCIISDARKI